MSCDMRGFATQRELYDLRYRLSCMSEPERRANKFALLVGGKFLDGQEAYEYLMKKQLDMYQVMREELGL